MSRRSDSPNPLRARRSKTPVVIISDRRGAGRDRRRRRLGRRQPKANTGNVARRRRRWPDAPSAATATPSCGDRRPRSATPTRRAAVHISSPAGDLDATAAGVGLTLDQPATVTRHDGHRRRRQLAQEARCGGSARSAVRQAARWRLHRRLDPARGRHHRARPGQPRRPDRAQPSTSTATRASRPRPGAPGRTIDVGELGRSARRRRRAPGSRPIKVDIAATAVPPTVQRRRRQGARREGQRRSPGRRSALSIGGKSATIPTKTLRAWLSRGARADGRSTCRSTDQDRHRPAHDRRRRRHRPDAGLASRSCDDAADAHGDQVQIIDGQQRHQVLRARFGPAHRRPRSPPARPPSPST